MLQFANPTSSMVLRSQYNNTASNTGIFRRQEPSGDPLITLCIPR